MPRPKCEIEYDGKPQKLYNIRLYSNRDKAIKDKLVSISNGSGIPLEKVILTYLKKGLALSEVKEFDISKENLIEGFLS